MRTNKIINFVKNLKLIENEKDLMYFRNNCDHACM